MDFRNDNNAFGIEYVKSALKDSLPSYLKDEETKDLTKVASSAFADEINREYPINSKKNTWQSIAYFYTQGKVKMASAKADEVEKQLMLASIVHGIKEDAKAIVSVISDKAESIKTASASEKEYAIERDGKGYLPINSEEEVIISSRELDDNYLKLEPTLAKTAAIKIVKKAKELGIANREYLSSHILAQGTERIFDYKYAIKVASERSKKTGCDLYIDIVDSANEAYSQGKDLLKFASEFYKLDKAFGMANYGDYGVQDPCGIFFNGMEKSAADKFIEDNVLFKDIFIPLSEFKSNAFKENVTNFFPKKIASSILESCKGNSIDIKNSLSKLDEKTKLDLLKVLAS